MKVLLLIDSLVSGGRERRLVGLIKRLKDLPDFEMMLVLFSNKIHYKEIHNYGIPIIVLERKPKRNPLVFYRLFKICQEWRPNLLHSWGIMSAIWAIPSSILLRIKLINGNIYDAPTNMPFFDKRLFRARFTFPFSAVVVGNSKSGLEVYHVPKSKGICVYNGFDFDRLLNVSEENAVREKFGIKTKKVVGMVGAFFDRKDYNTFLKAAIIVLKERKDVTFVSVGDGPNLKECKELVPPQLSPYCIFTGSQTDVESIINVFDIGVLSTNSMVHGEGISNSLLEYMAFEKPVIASKGGGTHEIVLDKETGILVPPFSAETMAGQINYLLENPKEAEGMGQKGKKRIYEKFNLSKMTEVYVELYRNLLKNA